MYVLIAGVCWLIFAISWFAAALWTAAARSHGAVAQQLIYLLGFAVGFGLLFAPVDAALGIITGRHGPAPLFPRLWDNPDWLSILLIAVEIGAFAFAWWARIHLGKLWSGMLTLRDGHRVVDTGPYALVRHPIYTGLIAASWAFALIAGTITALAGAIVLTLVMTIKATTEEALLRRELGAQAYDDYARRVPMLVPMPSRGPR